MTLYICLSLLTIHFVADFLFQSDWMAINKSKSWLALTTHVSIYSICFSICGPAFVAITFVTHFITDAITSRITSALWFLPVVHEDGGFYTVRLKPTRHWFFVVIGVDQLIHAWTLLLTYRYLNG